MGNVMKTLATVAAAAVTSTAAVAADGQYLVAMPAVNNTPQGQGFAAVGSADKTLYTEFRTSPSGDYTAQAVISPVKQESSAGSSLGALFGKVVAAVKPAAPASAASTPSTGNPVKDAAKQAAAAMEAATPASAASAATPANARTRIEYHGQFGGSLVIDTINGQSATTESAKQYQAVLEQAAGKAADFNSKTVEFLKTHDGTVAVCAMDNKVVAASKKGDQAAILVTLPDAKDAAKSTMTFAVNDGASFNFASPNEMGKAAAYRKTVLDALTATQNVKCSSFVPK